MKTTINADLPQRAKQRSIKKLLAIALFMGVATASQAQVGTPSDWGYNASGQIGNGSHNDSLTPFSLSALNKIVQVAHSGIASYARKSDGTVWAWGANGVGQMGSGAASADITAPVKIAALSKIGDISASPYHALAVKSDGTVWAWGRNSNGQIGNGSNTDALSPVQVSGIGKAVKVAAGAFHSLALKSDGTVWAWGYNGYGELGDNTTTSSNAPVQVVGLTNVVAISAGEVHSLALKADGTVWAWGSNQSGQFASGTVTSSSVPVQLPNLSGVTQIAAGGYHSVFLKSDGTVWAGGYNASGQVGDGTTTNTPVAHQVIGLANSAQIAAGESHTVALNADGTVWAWGLNTDGELGDGTTNSSSVPVQVQGLTNQTYIAAGFQHSLSVQALQVASKLAASSLQTQYGQPIQLTAVLKNGANGLAISQEPVNFTLDGVSIGVAITNSAGKAVIMVANPAGFDVGSHAIGASFSGDRLYLPATQASSTLTVAKANAITTAKAVSTYFGSTASLKSFLKRAFDKAAISGETVAFKLDGAVIGQAATDGVGLAALSYKVDEPLAVGDHTMSVEFGGDSHYNLSEVQSKLTILQTPTKLSGFHATASAGMTIPFKIKLTRRPDAMPLANKTIRLVIGGSQIASGVTDGTGIAKMTYPIPSNMAAGDYPVTIFFDGDANYRAESHSISVLTIRP